MEIKTESLYRQQQRERLNQIGTNENAKPLGRKKESKKTKNKIFLFCFKHPIQWAFFYVILFLKLFLKIFIFKALDSQN